MQTRKNSSRIARRAVKKGARPSGPDSPEVEKSATESNSSQNDLSGHQNQDEPNSEPTVIKNTKQKEKRNKWSTEDYRNVLRAFYTAQLRPMGNVTQQTYEKWREIVGTEVRKYINANKLSNVRRDIIKNKRLNDAQIEQIRNEITGIQPEENAAYRRDEQLQVQLTNLSANEIENIIQQVRNGRNVVQEKEQEHTRRDVPPEQEHLDIYLDLNKEKVKEARINIIRELSVVEQIDMMKRENLPKISSNSKANEMIKLYNVALREIIERTDKDLTTINNLFYSAAKVITTQLGIKIKKSKKRNTHKPPKWKIKIQKEIDSLRAEISILDEIMKGTNVKTRKARNIRKKHNITNIATLATAKESVMQRMQLKAQRLKRYDKRSKFYRQNKIFKTDAKRFYREIGKSKIDIKDPPDMNKVEEFWKDIWGKEKTFNNEAPWLDREEERMREIEEQGWIEISVNELGIALGKSHKWKSPGIDRIPNFWLNALSVLHKPLADCMNDIMNHPNTIPEWLTEGITYLLPKTQETENPKNYRPITCLTTTYKILTSIITDRTYEFLEQSLILPQEQKGCKRNSYGCKDQLLINRMIIENCKTRLKNLSTAWIDYRKAFDSVPHDWILRSLELYKVSPFISNFLRNSMSKWRTRLFLSHNEGVGESHAIKIKRGIFQGDSLSPLLFCISLIPLSNELNNTRSGYNILQKVVNHLFYMDDLKLYAKNDQQLEGLLTTVKQFSNDICMEFGLDKCAKATFIRGKLKRSTPITLDIDTTIKQLDPEDSYKYLGVNESDGIDHAKMKERIRKEYYRRVRLVLKTELNSKNRIEAINTLAIPVVQYSYNIINWNLPDLQRMDRKTRKLLTANRMLHPKADVDRLYLPRREGGRGLIQLELSYKTSTVGMKHYLCFSNDWMLQLVLQHESTKKLHSILKEGEKFERELNVDPIVEEQDLQATKIAKKAKINAKKKGQDILTERWSQKSLHGQYLTRSRQADVDKVATHQWLRSSGLKAETEGFILAAQDQSLSTRNYQANVLKNGADPKCRFCDQYTETIDHLISGCPVLAPNEFIRRHDRVGKYLHWGICNHYGIDTTKNWFEHDPQPVTNGKSVTILWDFSVHTDRTIQANRPDIIVKDYTTKTCLLIDMSVPSDKNISVKEFDKLSKYKDLEIEIRKMWNLKTTIVPVIVGALGMIKKGTQAHLDKIPGHHSIQEIQKIVLTSTAHILRKTLSI